MAMFLIKFAARREVLIPRPGALDFVQALRIGTYIARITTVATVHPENVYGLFEKVCVRSS